MEEFSRLCCLIVEDVYGGFLARIFQQLSQLGRLSANQLAQRCRLPLRHVKTGMAALIQLRLIYHHTTPDGLSTYQANTYNAYNLVRAGKLMALVERNLGPVAARIMKILNVLGSATAGELESRVFGDEASGFKRKSAPLTNGFSDDRNEPGVDSRSKTYFRAMLRQLADKKYIVAVRDAHFQSLFDARQDVERHLRSLGTLPSGKGKKLQSDIDEKVNAELETRLDATVPTATILQEFETRSSNAETGNTSQDKTVLCINYANLIVSIRNEKIASTAEKLFGNHTAQIARAACLQIDIDSEPLKLQSSNDPSASTHKLNMSRISHDLVDQGTSNSFDESEENGWPVGAHLANGHHVYSTNGTKDLRDVENHLAVLAEGPFSFFFREPKSDSWAIHKKKMDDFLRDRELIRLMGESLSGPALRIIRMLIDKGKADEKTLQEVGLLGAKEVRRCLAQMQMMGFLELQEVPREPQRQPNRTIFLWFYDAERVRKVFLGRLYKAMSRLFQHLQLERGKLSSTLSKIERSDVQGSEPEMLSPAELQVLYQWRQRETWLLAEINRLDDSVAILRDL
ncbi:uncharacterized protein Z518_11411 [Rhinocladiella mackenziei CBS 650.93]|uniref:DNA-directed RNA polymerase III subunit RPC3 n=1 Tax=Rhinocladiella mackenziei CBS 650.93 TaxID=1442369 RepID=A0A0D2I131_9EURO|nr:uncharacterized protein Z518_11411 [Rhinocladiella mackenziei CBS 650.93]KIW99423.1 hypothetical protein Z518_11411 [Rhinocladiella mackenziei CBS 650.93]